MEEKIDAKLSFLKSLNRVQGLIEPVKKDSENPHFHNRYASLAAVNEAVMGPLTEAGFVLVQGGKDIGGKPYLNTTLYHVDGFSIFFDYPLTISDNPQHVSSSCTYAARVSICRLLNLSMEDDDAEGAAAPIRSAASRPATSSVTATKRNEIPEGDGLARFVPSKVEFVEGKGKGVGKTFSEIYRADGAKFSGNEMQGEIATAAKNGGKEIIVVFEKKGQYCNIKREGVKLAEDTKDVPF